MNDKYQVGQFGKFEWWDNLETRLGNKSITTKRPMKVEGAIIKKVNHKTITIKDMTGIPYVVPMSSCVYTPMDVKK